MKLPKIPVWLLPWTARKRISELERQVNVLTAANASLRDAPSKQQELEQKLAAATQEKAAMSQQEQKNKHAISALLAWIYATHRIDQRANQTGLADILKDFPPVR